MLLDRRLLLAGGVSAALAIPARAQDSVVEAAVEVTDHRVALPAQMNGRGPFRLVIDTGAELSGIRQAVADTLGLRPQRQVRLNGRPFPLYAIDELVLGGAVRQSRAGFFGLGEAPGLGGDGLAAAGLITSLDSELLFEAQRWRLHPSGLADVSRYTAVAARLEQPRAAGLSARPHGRVDVGGIELDTVWDTGAPHALSVPQDVAARLGLMQPDRPYALMPSRGIHGPASRPARLFAAPPIRVGEQVFEGVRAIVRMDDATAGAAILGFPVLRCLDLAIARGGAFIGVRRNALRPVGMPYSLAGVWVDDYRGGVRVSEVGVGSPGAEAGLRPGDVITNLGAFSSALAALRGPAGTALPVTWTRGGQTLSATLRLRDYLSA